MRTRNITDEQLILLDKLMKEGMGNDDIYKVLGVNFSTLNNWKRKIKDIGLDNILAMKDSRMGRRVGRMKQLNALEIGDELFVEDGSEFTSSSLVSSMYNVGKKFSKIRQAVGWTLKRVS